LQLVAAVVGEEDNPVVINLVLVVELVGEGVQAVL
jgi:hypothetical protein